MIKMQIIGHVGSDAEVVYLDNGISVTKFSIAHSYTWKDKEGLKNTTTTWVKVDLWNKEKLAIHIKKGICLYVEGEPYSSAWLNKENEVRSNIVLKGHRVDFVGNKKSESATNTTVGSGTDVQEEDDKGLPF